MASRALDVPANLLSLDDWKAKARAGAAPTGVVLRKQYIAQVLKADGESGSRKRSFTISTGVRDRDRDTLAVAGWELGNYLKNPVVLWAHMYRELPIARASDVAVVGDELRASAEFAGADLYPFAETVLRMLDGGFLRAVSVGFNPLSHSWNDEQRGVDFLKQELMEYSVVPVPANPEALMDAKAAGIDVAPLRAWAERVLDETSEEPGLWLPKSRVEEAFKALAPRAVAVPGAGASEAAGAHNPGAPGSTPGPATNPEKAGGEIAAAAPFVPDLARLEAVVRSSVSEVAQAQVNRALGRLD